MRLIDADGLLREGRKIKMRDAIPGFMKMQPMEMEVLAILGAVYKRLIDNAPTVCATQVVRCRDCRLRGREECAMYYRCNCGEQHTWEADDDFCSRGERRTE